MLAGGAGRRLAGSPKGLLEVGGRRMIDRVADALRGCTTELLLVSNDANAGTWLRGATVTADRFPGTGGLAGVDVALAKGDCLVVAWDMPFVSAALLDAIMATARATSADVVVPESESPFGFEPFCAYYSARVAGPLSVFLEGGGGAAHAFLDPLARVERLALADVKRLGDPQRFFLSVNTPEDLARARAMA